jgi:hypothetical protein
MDKHRVSFLYKYKEGKTSWELIINIDLKSYSTLVVYIANIYGYDVITKDHKSSKYTSYIPSSVL